MQQNLHGQLYKLCMCTSFAALWNTKNSTMTPLHVLKIDICITQKHHNLLFSWVHVNKWVVKKKKTKIPLPQAGSDVAGKVLIKIPLNQSVRAPFTWSNLLVLFLPRNLVKLSRRVIGTLQSCSCSTASLSLNTKIHKQIASISYGIQRMKSTRTDNNKTFLTP